MATDADSPRRAGGAEALRLNHEAFQFEQDHARMFARSESQILREIANHDAERMSTAPEYALAIRLDPATHREPRASDGLWLRIERAIPIDRRDGLAISRADLSRAPRTQLRTMMCVGNVPMQFRAMDAIVWRRSALERR